MVLLPGFDKKEIIVYFVKCEDFKKTMAKTFFCCTKANIKVWIIPKEEINQVSHHKNIIFVLNKFAGKSFEYLQSKNCQIVGPKCLYTCVTKKMPIPDNNSPVFCLAMLGVVATSTKISKKLKESLGIIIGYMGGIYLEHLSPDVTHLLSNGGITPKIEAAINHQIPIMSPYWITDIWEMSQTKDIVKDNDECIKYRLPPFKGLVITSSNVPQLEKMRIKALIEAHGGTYTTTLQKTKTSILITDDVESKKFKHAQEWGILSLKPSWIYESAGNGYPVVIKSHLTSQNQNSSKNLLNSSMDLNEKSDIINETKNSLSFEIEKESRNMEFLDKIDFLKIAPGFLDGCKIYLSGFKTGEVQKIKKIINKGNATLYNSISNSLTHILVSNCTQEIKNLDPFLKEKTINLDWLKASVDLKNPAPRQDFAFFNINRQLTPDSEKFLKIHKFKENSENTQIFGGLSFYLWDFYHPKKAVNTIKKFGGKITENEIEADYTIVPLIYSTKTQSSPNVTLLWIEDCVEKGETLKIEYYHKPIAPQQKNLLRNCVISTSGLTGAEKSFLVHVAIFLGAKVQSCFASENHANLNILKTTHLLCHNTSSEKYKAALKLGIPIINKDWILSHVQYDENYDKINQSFKQERKDDSQIEKNDKENTYKDNWKKWMEDLPELYKKSKEMQDFRNAHFKTDLNIVMKQLWVKFGGARVNGIDPETGELLPDGPFKKFTPQKDRYLEKSSDLLSINNKRKLSLSEPESQELQDEVTLKKNKNDQINEESKMDQRIFGFSNIIPDLRKKYSKIIKSLGGNVSHARHYDEKITHLLTDKLNLNEKILCSIASRKWILHPSYIKECNEFRTFINEENFEWGNIQSHYYVPEIEQNTVGSWLARAGFQWRNNKDGVYKNFKVVIIAEESKVTIYEQLIRAGGGTVLDKRNIFEATHIFWDQISDLPVEKAIICDQKKTLLDPMYMIDYLLTMCKTDLNKHLV